MTTVVRISDALNAYVFPFAATHVDPARADASLRNRMRLVNDCQSSWRTPTPLQIIRFGSKLLLAAQAPPVVCWVTRPGDFCFTPRRSPRPVATCGCYPFVRTVRKRASPSRSFARSFRSAGAIITIKGRHLATGVFVNTDPANPRSSAVGTSVAIGATALPVDDVSPQAHKLSP
jgi:hypothetical protein